MKETITSNKKQQEALKNLPKNYQSILTKFCSENSFSIIPNDAVDILLKKNKISMEQLGIHLLPLAASFSIAPISNFYVGAVAFDNHGNAYLGANFEFDTAHIAQTIHAEQSAIANAWSHGAKKLSLLVINYAPCGHCRQFINEVNLSDDFRIKLPDSDAKPLSYYLPDAFGPNDLDIDSRILQTAISEQDSLSLESESKLYKAAYEAMINSHAPYSTNKSGIALEYINGEIITGFYAENAAFNPSLPALQVALNNKRLKNDSKNWQDVKSAIMVESINHNQNNLTQQQNCKNLLQSFANIDLEYYAV